MPDIPNDVSTSATVSLGGTYSGRLETNGDRDWVRINLTAGTTVQLNLDASGNDPMSDPYMRIYDRNSNLIYSDDDSGPGFNSKLVFVADYTGPYYIEAAAYSFTDTGDYRITAATTTIPPAGSPLASIDWGAAQADTNVTVYFVPNGETRDGYTSEGFNAFEQAQFRQAFDQIEAVSGLTFTVVNDPNADFQLVLDTNELLTEGDGTLAFFYPPGQGNSSGIGVFNGAAWDRIPGGDLEMGGYGYVTVVHEVLHGVGLAHPHDDGGTSTIMAGVSGPFGDYGDFNLNQGVFTVMSYNSGYSTGNNNGPSGGFGYEAGPMALDIAMLQLKYGTGGAANPGGTTYVLPDAGVTITSWQAIWDTGGNDTIAYNGRNDVTIDLRAANLSSDQGAGGYISAAAGVAGGFTIANDVVIEFAKGGSGNDTLIGNSANNQLIGRHGADRLFGAGGRDRLLGGDGDDTLSAGNGRDALLGGTGNDTLQGGRDADVLSGGGGRDTFVFNNFTDSRANDNGRDQINDFIRGQDQVDLSFIDANRFQAGDQEFTFIRRQIFDGDGQGQVRWETTGSDILVSVDQNGNGSADMQIALRNVSWFDAADFIL